MYDNVLENRRRWSELQASFESEQLCDERTDDDDVQLQQQQQQLAVINDNST